MMVIDKSNWVSVLFLFRGTALGRIWPRLVMVLAVAVGVTVAHANYGYFEEGLTIVPFTLIGLALGIFLGFRNNTSYDRFWEGRKLWGRLVNTSRTLTRQMMTLIGPAPGDSGDDRLGAIHTEMVHRLVAYVHAFRHHLRSEEMLEDARPFLPAVEAAALENESNVPIAILHRMGERFRELYAQKLIHPHHFQVLEDSLAQLTDIQGACERIKSTPIPTSYNALMHRLVAAYVFALPFGIVQSIGAFTPEVTLLVAYAFLGLDAIGEEIEQPFGTDPNDLPLTALSRMIEVNIRQRLGETDLPPLEKPVRGVLN